LQLRIDAAPHAVHRGTHLAEIRESILGRLGESAQDDPLEVWR
jgi:hypothetical protein